MPCRPTLLSECERLHSLQRIPHRWRMPTYRRSILCKQSANAKNRTCDGVERIEWGRAHEVHRYINQYSHRPGNKDGARDSNCPIPERAESGGHKTVVGEVPAQPTAFQHHSSCTPRLLFLCQPCVCEGLLAGVVRDAERLERALRYKRPDQIKGCQRDATGNAGQVPASPSRVCV